MINCQQCGQVTNNPKFCTRSCAVVWNNTYRPKRVKSLRVCKLCSNYTMHSRKTFCEDCLQMRAVSNRTLGELRGRRKYQIHSQVRTYARKVYYRHKDAVESCQNCGYAKHIEICHIKAVSSFPQETLIADINKFENLVALCPNCHWELDNGLLTLT